MGYNKISADDIIKNLSAEDLDEIFKYFGEERNAKFIAKKIVKEREINHIDTEYLVKLVNLSKKVLLRKIKRQKFFKL